MTFSLQRIKNVKVQNISHLHQDANVIKKTSFIELCGLVQKRSKVHFMSNSFQ